MSVHDPMLDYTINKLKNGIKELQHLGEHSTYTYYAPKIASSMAHDIKAYQDYLDELLQEKVIKEELK